MGLIKLLPWIIIIVVALVYFSRQKQRREKEQMEEELREMRRRLEERERNRDVAPRAKWRSALTAARSSRRMRES